MQISYIILAHKNPRQVKRLIDRLREEWVDFYIHIDKNVTITEFEYYLKNYGNVHFLPEDDRFPGVWGDIGIVEATLAAMKMITANNKNGYCILMTGQDYPIRSNKSIFYFFKKNYGKNFISVVQTPTSWHKPYMDRITKYKINKSAKRGHFLQFSSIFDKDFYNLKTPGKLNYLRKTGQSKEILNIFKKRQFPQYIQPFGGGVYFALPLKLIREILNFHTENPDFLEWNRYTLCADEVFFHSIIMKIQKKDNFKPERSLTYVNWDRPSGPLPVTFEKTDYEEIENASKDFLWARKFDLNQDNEILDLIDKTLLI